MPPKPVNAVRSLSAAALASVTGHDVARAAGVSQSTVSRAFRNDARLSQTKRAHVLEVAKALGYTPSHLGRSLVTRLTRTVGMAVTDLENPFYPHVVAPLHDALAGLGYRMVLFMERLEGGENDQLALDRLLDRSTDGIVLTTTLLGSAIPRELARRGLPFVFLVRVSDDVGGDCAVVDNALGASLMAAEILRHGHRRVGAIFGPAETSTGRDRERGLRAGLGVADVELPDELVCRGPYGVETGSSGMERLMKLPMPPTAIFCGNDTIAIGALNAARRRDIEVPGEVSLVGFDDLPMAGWDVFQLTTVHQPMEEMARTAAQLLVDRVEGRSEPGQVRRAVFEPLVVIRSTLGPPPKGRL
ncbi:MAG: LacI family DNA-binding transcriptional regulator [Candidatus Dormibacter sp.]|uniref:LacI family DNA-binding transcriptional regulator n=1 Tax=Candidatus Dormibacter sp. TaxID=2973982 RepID=UPI000DB0BC43|nr:MAG: LacI family transcriptional regulator [Candidatus Dormibacteraeota bacterium]